jgi:hypothetical protein
VGVWRVGQGCIETAISGDAGVGHGRFGRGAMAPKGDEEVEPGFGVARQPVMVALVARAAPLLGLEAVCFGGWSSWITGSMLSRSFLKPIM